MPSFLFLQSAQWILIMNSWLIIIISFSQRSKQQQGELWLFKDPGKDQSWDEHLGSCSCCVVAMAHFTSLGNGSRTELTVGMSLKETLCIHPYQVFFLDGEDQVRFVWEICRPISGVLWASRITAHLVLYIQKQYFLLFLYSNHNNVE